MGQRLLKIRKGLFGHGGQGIEGFGGKKAKGLFHDVILARRGRSFNRCVDGTWKKPRDQHQIQDLVYFPVPELARLPVPLDVPVNVAC